MDGVVHAIEGAATASAEAASATSLAALLTRHVLRDGELVILILKPSVWFILLSSVRFVGVVLLVVAGMRLLQLREMIRVNTLAYVEAGVFLVAGRLMWAAMQWTARLYVLTDLRIIRIAGVFNVSIFDCPLRKVARTRVIYTVRERVFGVGSIEIIPGDESLPVASWQMIGRPVRVHETVVATITRAKQGGSVE